MLSRFMLKPDNFPANKDFQAAQAHPVQIAARMAGQQCTSSIIKTSED